jgi:hypothetical protein
MTESVDKFVRALQTGNNADAGDAFKDALRDKIADRLDGHRKDVASKIFNPTVQNFSPEKPPVTDPSPRTDQVMDTDGNEIEFTPNTQPEPEATAPEAPAPEAEAPVANEVEAQ